MNEYNEKWTREKFIEYRKLKRNGYSHEQLKEHFGDDIWHSGLYNKNANLLPFSNFINEIKINPIELPYKRWEMNSYFYKNKTDYFAEFESNGIYYTIIFMYYTINNKDTYNIIFTTSNQYKKYEKKFKQYIEKGNITEDELNILKNILEKQTKLNDIINILKRLSFIIFDMYYRYTNNHLLSIGDTDDYRKIKLYRNVIKDSFENIIETEDYENNILYYLYNIK
jgi:hypothetical protein